MDGPNDRPGMHDVPTAAMQPVALQRPLFDLFRGESPERHGWLERI
jgi:hypothetical protein